MTTIKVSTAFQFSYEHWLLFECCCFVKCDKFWSVVMSCNIRVLSSNLYGRKRISFLCDDNIALNSNRYYRQFLKRPRFSFGKNGYDDIDKKSGNTDNAMHMVLNTKVIRYLFTRIIDLFPSYTLESLSLN